MLKMKKSIVYLIIDLICIFMVIKYAYYIALGWLIFLSVISNLIAWLNNHTMLAIFFL
jgi:hypothetical protein